METKIYAAILIMLIIGLVSGYFVGSITQQDQVPSYEDELDSKNQQIASLQTEVQDLEDQIESKNIQITNLETEIQTLQEQADAANSQITDLEAEVNSMRVSVELEEVVWDTAADTVNFMVRNTGGVKVIIGAINLKETSGESWYTDTSTAATGTINAGETKSLVWNGGGIGFDLLPATSYSIRIDYSSNYATQHLGTTP